MKKSTLQETKQRSEMTISPGLAFLSTAVTSMPKSIGDRLFTTSMNAVLQMADVCQMLFDDSDGASLAARHLAHESSVGVFRPLDQYWYEFACWYRSTPYATMWEKHMNFRPWRANNAFAGHHAKQALPPNSRVAPGIAVLLPSPNDEPKDTLKHNNLQVWWCTSFDRASDMITLCRYRPGVHGGAFSHEGSPVARRKVSRDDWDALVRRGNQASQAQEQ